MKIGVIAEGRGDCAVLRNIIWGIFPDLAENDIPFLRSNFGGDNSDKSAKKGVYKEMPEDEFGSWSLVKKDCEEQEQFRKFLEGPIVEERYIIIQIDTAECEEKGYDVERPNKKEEAYCETLRNAVVDKINEWLQNNWEDKVFYAICIEETEEFLRIYVFKNHFQVSVFSHQEHNKTFIEINYKFSE